MLASQTEEQQDINVSQRTHRTPRAIKRVGLPLTDVSSSVQRQRVGEAPDCDRISPRVLIECMLALLSWFR